MGSGMKCNFLHKLLHEIHYFPAWDLPLGKDLSQGSRRTTAYWAIRPVFLCASSLAIVHPP
jgi:hypothetical protein